MRESLSNSNHPDFKTFRYHLEGLPRESDLENLVKKPLSLTEEFLSFNNSPDFVLLSFVVRNLLSKIFS